MSRTEVDGLSGDVMISLSLLLLLLRPDATRDTTEESVLSLLFLRRTADLAVGTVNELSLLSPLFFRTGLVSEGRGGKAGRSDRFSDDT